MNLNELEINYFIQEVAYSAVSFGVSMEDIAPVGVLLGKTFNNKCGPATAVPSTSTPASQSVCLDNSCPTAANASCTADNTGANGTAPAPASGSSSMSGSGSGSSTGSGSSGSTKPSAGEKLATAGVGALFAAGAFAVSTVF